MIRNSEPTDHVMEWTLHAIDAIELHALSKRLTTVTHFLASNDIVLCFFYYGPRNNFTANCIMRYESNKIHASGDEPSP